MTTHTPTSEAAAKEPIGLLAGAGRLPIMVAEGVKTSKVVMELAEKYGVDMPIAREVYGVVHEGASAMDAYRGLTRRPAGAEREPA